MKNKKKAILAAILAAAIVCNIGGSRIEMIRAEVMSTEMSEETEKESPMLEATEEKEAEEEKLTVYTDAQKAEAPKAEEPAEKNMDLVESEEETKGVKVPTGEEVVAFAKQFVGNPYVYGGVSLTEGCDCSGFTMSVYAQFGYTLPHPSYSQQYCGEEVSLSELQPGDIIYYSNHVALYIGNEEVVHAQCAAKGICITPMYYNQPLGARRIIGKMDINEDALILPN